MHKAHSPTTKYPYRKQAKVLFVVAVLLAAVGVVLYATAEQEAMASALVAWIPSGFVLVMALSIYWWDGKDDVSGGGHVGPL